MADTLDSGKAEFYVDSIRIHEDGFELDVAGHMEDRSGHWNNISGAAPITNERHPGNIDRSMARHVKTNAANDGIESDATFPITSGYDYLLLARVYPITGQVQMKVPGVTHLTAVTSNEAADMATWQTLRAVLHADDNFSARHVQFLTAVGAGEFYVDSVHLLKLSELLQWQDFRYDYKGRAVEEASINIDTAEFFQQVNRAYYFSGEGNGLLQSVTQRSADGVGDDVTTTYTYDSAGRVVKTHQSSLFGSCLLSYTVYDEAGNVTATVCVNPADTSTSIPTTVEEARAIYSNDPENPYYPATAENKVTTYEYDTLGRRVKTIVNDGMANPDRQVTLTFYDALNRVTRTISNYVDDSYTAPGNWSWNGSAWEDEANALISHGADNNQNVVSDTAYNARGMVMRQRDTLGNLTLYGYDDAGWLVKTIQNASQNAENPEDEHYYDNDYNETGDPTLASYEPIEAADQDVITTQEYDAVGNLVKTVDPLERVNFTVYDALNRPVKTIQSAHAEATVSLDVGDFGYAAANDPRSEAYEISTNPDCDLIQTTDYDNMGRVIRTMRLLENRNNPEEWETTLYGYDSLGRQIIVIQKASDADYDVANDADLSEYDFDSDPDQDIITKTAYDPNGRVKYTEDAMGSRTWMGYDGLGRQVRTVLNAVGDGYSGEISDPRSSSYTPSNDADKDLINTTVYNADGQVESTQDALERVTRNVYDARGRIIRTIANYVSQGSSNPENWVWSSTNNRWEYGLSDTTAISHGTNNDRNIVSDTLYDVQGRVLQTLDNRHNTTQFVYDGMGRRVKTISNYVVQGSSDPNDWIWSSANNRWEDGAGNAISFGMDTDQNRISLTVYDLVGRIIRTRNAAGLETQFSYDALGRRTQTISNYVDGSFNSAAPDEDLISTTTYNKAGQVVSTTDARSTQTAFTYDKAGRRLTVTQAADISLASTGYSVYDKAGRVLRSIANYKVLDGMSPDSKPGGVWEFVPPHHGSYNDTNLITEFGYDLASRRVSTIDPVGNVMKTGYFKDGQVDMMFDPDDAVNNSKYLYDGLRRRTRVIQNYVPQDSSDPKDWIWVPDPDPDSDPDMSAWKQS